MVTKLHFLLFLSVCTSCPDIAQADIPCPNTWRGQELFTFKYRQGCVTLVPKLFIAHCMEQHDAHYPVCTDNYCDDNFPFGHLLFLDQLHDISNKPNLISGQKWLHGGALLSHSAEYSRVFGDGNTYRCLNFTHWCSRRSEFGCANKTSKYYCKQVNDENNVMAKGITLSRLKLDMKKLTQDWTGPMCRNVCFKSDGIVELCDFYECRKGQDHEWIPCMHEGRYPCERVRKEGCNYNKALQYCVTHYYTEVPPERRKHQRCDPDDYGQRCNCTCTRPFSPWTQWTATCGTAKRIRIAAYYQPNIIATVNCSFENQKECCVETDTHILSPCTDYIYGTNISLATTSCAQKGGTRGRDALGHYICNCKKGYHGLLCEQQDDNCISQPCENGGTCTSNGPYFICKCKAGYKGEYCEETYDTCDRGAKCLNGGTCKPTAEGYVCVCKSNFAGALCEKRYESCQTNTCQPNGECFDLPELGTFKCYCKKGYTGRLCDSLKTADPNVSNDQKDLTFLITLVVFVALMCLCVAIFIQMRMKKRGTDGESTYTSSTTSLGTSYSRTTRSTNTHRTSATTTRKGSRASSRPAYISTFRKQSKKNKTRTTFTRRKKRPVFRF